MFSVKKSVLINAAKYLLGIVLLAAVIWWNWSPAPGKGLAPIWQRHFVEGQPIHWLAFMLAGCFCAFAVLLTFVRWYLLVRAVKLPFTLTNALRLGLVSYYFNTILPGSIGGDILKAAFIAKEQTRRTVAVATVIIDRAIGLWALFWLVALLGVFFWLGGQLAGNAQRVCESIILGAVGIVAGSLVVWLLLGFLPAWRADKFASRLEKIPKVGHAAAEFWRAVYTFRQEARIVFLALGLAIVGHVAFVSTFYYAAIVLQDANQVPSRAQHFLIIPIGMAIQAGIPTPGGVGGGEYVFGSLYELIGFSAASGILMSLVYRVVTWILGFCGYLVHLRMRPAIKSLQAELREEDALAHPTKGAPAEVNVSA
jgi:uncharacterized protein (TIRG00374 family)